MKCLRIWFDRESLRMCHSASSITKRTSASRHSVVWVNFTRTYASIRKRSRMRVNFLDAKWDSTKEVTWISILVWCTLIETTNHLMLLLKSTIHRLNCSKLRRTCVLAANWSKNRPKWKRSTGRQISKYLSHSNLFHSSHQTKNCCKLHHNMMKTFKMACRPSLARHLRMSWAAILACPSSSSQRCDVIWHQIYSKINVKYVKTIHAIEIVFMKIKNR